jgi:hypothetical protein
VLKFLLKYFQYGVLVPVIDAMGVFFYFFLGYSRKQRRKIPFSASIITANLITGEPAGAYEAGHQADPPHHLLVLRGEEPQSLRDKLH